MTLAPIGPEYILPIAESLCLAFGLQQAAPVAGCPCSGAVNQEPSIRRDGTG